LSRSYPQNVTQRYRANIMMTRLNCIDSSRLDAAVAAIGPLFDAPATG
jgi:hypothetical protein